MSQNLLHNRYLLGDLLGKGAFGKVYKAIDVQTGITVAVKQIQLKNNKIAQEDLQEIELLRTVIHKNIVKYLDHFQTSNQLCIVTEYIEGGSLQSTFKNYGILAEEYYSKIIYQVLLGLVELHRLGILHRDLKAANLLADKENHIYITDFGVSEKLTQKPNLEAIAGTPYWIAREVILMERCDEKSDIWGLGATLYELLSGSPPYYALQPMSAMYHIATDSEIVNIPTVYPAAWTFIKRCFDFNVDLRPSAEQLLVDPFITKYNKQEEHTKTQLLLNDCNFDDAFSESQSSFSSEINANAYDVFAGLSKKQIQNFQAGNYELLSDVKRAVLSTSSDKGAQLLEQLRQAGFQVLVEGLEQTRMDDELENEQKLNKSVTIKIYLLKLIAFLLRTAQTPVEILFELISLHFLNELQKVSGLYSLYRKGLVFIEEELKLSQTLAEIIDHMAQQPEIFPLFSAKQGFKAIFAQPEFFQNYQVTASAVNFLKTICSSHIQTKPNIFQKEFLSALTQSQILPVLILLIQKLTFYSIDTKQFSPDDNLTASSDFGPDKRHYRWHDDVYTIQSHNKRIELIVAILRVIEQVVHQNQINLNFFVSHDNIKLIFKLIRYFAHCSIADEINRSDPLNKQLIKVTPDNIQSLSKISSCIFCQDVNAYQFSSDLLNIFQRMHQVCAFNNDKFDFFDYLPLLEEIQHIQPQFKQQVILNFHAIFRSRQNLLFRTITESAAGIRFIRLLLGADQNIVFDTVQSLSQIPLAMLRGNVVQAIVNLNIVETILKFLATRPDEVFQMLTKLLALEGQCNSHTEKYKQEMAMLIKNEILIPQRLEVLSTSIFSEQNYQNEPFLSVAIELLENCKPLANTVEHSQQLMSNLVETALGEGQNDRRALHFTILQKIFEHSIAPEVFALRYNLFRRISVVEISCDAGAVQRVMKKFLAGLLQLDIV